MRAGAHTTGVILALLFPGEAFAQPRLRAGDLVIDCQGAFAKTASHATLVAAFGAKNVVYQKVQDAEGETPMASVVFPNDPNKRAEFIWQKPKQRREPLVKVNGGWRVPNGIRVGTTLKEVERLNRKPFRLSGFGWDLGGRVTDWNKGALDQPLPGGCLILVDFAADLKAPGKLIDKVTGDTSFGSNDPAMAAVKPRVAAMVIYYPGR